MIRLSRALIAPVVVLGLLVPPALELLALAQERAPAAVPGVDAKAPQARPGLIARFAAGEHHDARIDRLVALRLPAMAAPTPFIPPGPFTVTWEGELNLRPPNRLTFAADGRGEFRLEINGEVVLDLSGDDFADQTSEPVSLEQGANSLLARYTPPADGEAFVRLYTVKADGTRDPVLPTMLTHNPADAPLQQASQLRLGREVVAAQRCVHCHTAEGVRDHPSVMPEVAADAPALAGIGERLHEPWMARWINDPKHLRPDAAMPRLFHDAGAADEQIDPRARDVAAYLATLKPPRPARPMDEPTDELIGQGGRLFTALGCLSCHTLESDADTVDNFTRVPLGTVAEKYHPAALRDFLMRPERHYSWIRMPNFGFSRDEATQVATFLLARSKPADHPPLAAGDPERGKVLLQTSGCLTCHGAPVPNEFATKPLDQLLQSDLQHGCLADDAAELGSAPDLALDDDQRQAVRALLRGSWDSLTRDVPVEFAHRQVEALNCTACHVLDNQRDTWTGLQDEIAAIEKSLPPVPEPLKIEGDQSRPDLTWLGEKLRPQWMGQFIYGEIDYKPREWVVARMPSFASRARLLASGLALQHGFPTEPPPPEAPDPQLVPIGMKLVGLDGGFSCITCHAVGEMKATSPFMAQSPNFVHAPERLTEDFYHRWVRDPQRYEPGTRMPQYTDTDGQTALSGILDGESKAQFEAIWQYLLTAPDIQPPQ